MLGTDGLRLPVCSEPPTVPMPLISSCASTTCRGGNGHMGPRCGFRPAFGSWVAPSRCCYIWGGKHWLCLVVLGKRGKARHGWRREIQGGLTAALPVRLGTPRKPEDKGGDLSEGQSAQGRRGGGLHTCLVTSDLGSLFGCPKQWEGSRPVEHGQASPLFFPLDIQALTDTHGLTTPRKRAVL